MISLVIPTRNNLKYVQHAYKSIRLYFGNEVEIILLDDASTDKTWDWMCDELNKSSNNHNLQIYRNNGPDRVGHTVLYDIGASMASHEIFGIFHADMIATPNYIKNMVKHLKPGKVISGTRIEPPLHPPGPEKFVKDFGMEPENFNKTEFLNFVKNKEQSEAEKVSNGIFAPWIMYVKDFQAIGGHDKRVFAPMELEDSDLFNRFLLAGYEMLQSRDAFVYHMTCRGSRFKDGIKIIQEIPMSDGNVWKRSQDSYEYTKLRQIKFKEWWRKWHMDVLHDENMLPIVYPRYDVGFSVSNISKDGIDLLEPWCDTLYADVDSLLIQEIQSTSKFKITNKIKPLNSNRLNDIIINFDWLQFKQTHYNIIKQLPLIIKDSGEIGKMEYDIFQFDIKSLKTYEKKLIHSDDPWYLIKLL